MGRVEGKVALITGAARGQGRSHALRLAEEGADIIALDIGRQIGTVGYEMPGADALEETVSLVKEKGRRSLGFAVDVRDQKGLDDAVAASLVELGHIDIVCANAGILSSGPAWEQTEQQWQDTLDVNLTGAWHTLKAAAPHMIEQQAGGAMVIVSSLAGLKGARGAVSYVASKHGTVGLMRTFAHELGPYGIRVNSVHPTSVATPMVLNEVSTRAMRPDLENPTVEDTAEIRSRPHLLPIPWVDPIDISNAVLWLVSDEARYVTGVALPVDAGAAIK
jgi:SDR family mycofactocin-dependent oxidoreductase